MTAQTFKTPAGEEMVILSRADYDALLARLEETEEDAADVAAFDEGMAAAGDGRRRVVTPDETRGHYLRMRRKMAGQTQAELGATTGLAQGYISDLESGRRSASADALGRIAHALGIPDDELAPLRSWIQERSFPTFAEAQLVNKAIDSEAVDRILNNGR